MYTDNVQFVIDFYILFLFGFMYLEVSSVILWICVRVVIVNKEGQVNVIMVF